MNRALAVIVFVTPITGGHLLAQITPGTLPDLDQSWSAPTQLPWEREMRGSRDDLGWELAPGPSAAADLKGGALVSAEELRHPVSKKGQKLLEKAQRFAQAGNHSKAIEELNLAVQEPSAAPYAHGILGTEYLKLFQVTEAIQHLEEAIALMPKFAAHHSNLGYALCLLGQTEQGLKEIETALSLDWSLSRARFLEGAILLDQAARDKDAWDSLESAQREVPSAHLALAIYYVRHGQGGAADQQLRDYVELGLGGSLALARKWLNRVQNDRVAASLALGLWQQPALDTGY
jgi:tetratricopeptide (TPR) repeat protein